MTTTNTAAESLSDRLIDDTSPQAEAAPKKASLDMVARLIVDHYASEPDDYVISIGDLRNDPILGAPMREFVAYLQMPLGDFRAAIAAGGAQEAIYQVMVGDKWVDSTAAEYAAVSNEKRIVYASPLPRVAATVALTNLEGLRARLLAPRVIARDKDGWLWHPDYPVCDEGTRADKLLEAFGIETAFVGMESDAPDLAERWHEEGLTDCSEWTPTPPGGDGWLLLEIYDTEDGPYALFGRDHYAAEQARKKEHTRRLSEAVRRARLERAAASNGEQA